jgi:hypothetical protein
MHSWDTSTPRISLCVSAEAALSCVSAEDAASARRATTHANRWEDPGEEGAGQGVRREGEGEEGVGQGVSDPGSSESGGLVVVSNTVCT